MFPGCTVLPDSKEIELGSGDQEASPSTGKVLFAHGSASLQLLPVVWIFLRSLGVICYGRWVLKEGHKNYYKDCCLTNSQPTFQFLTYLNLMNMVILPKACKPDNFESHTQLSLTNNRSSFEFCWLWAFPWIKLSWHSCCVRKIWITQLILAISLWDVVFL